MTGTITLYHPIHAPDGQPVYADNGPLTTYADDGWVDDPAKIGVNPWGEDHQHHVAKRHREYLSGELPGISPGYGKDEGRRCAIWNTVATDESEPGRDGMSLNSPRAGGPYFISRSTVVMVASRDERVKARLTSWLVDQRRSGIRRPEVMMTTIDDAARYGDLTVQQRVDRLLGFIAERSPRIGAAFSLTKQETSCAAMAWTESTDMEEVRFPLGVLGHIEKRGWLETDESGPDQYVLTIDGHARLAELEGRDKGSSRAVGDHKNRESDVGTHELLEDIDFGLQHEPPDDDDRQARIDTLVEWFFERFEDPANRLPYAVQGDPGAQARLSSRWSELWRRKNRLWRSKCRIASSAWSVKAEVGGDPDGPDLLMEYLTKAVATRPHSPPSGSACDIRGRARR